MVCDSDSRGRAIAARNAGECVGILWNDANGEGARAVDGGNPCLHPAHHCRRRCHQARRQDGGNGRAGCVKAVAARRDFRPAGSAATAASGAKACDRTDGVGKARRPAARANSQDDIDAMLAELDAPPKAAPKTATPSRLAAPSQPAAAARSHAQRPAIRQPSPDVLDLTESMAAPATPSPGPAPSFRTIDGTSDVVFSNKPVAGAGSRADFQRDRRGGRQRIQFACAYRDRAKRAHARRSGEGNVAADAQVLARRQSAGNGRAHRARGNRTRFARPALETHSDQSLQTSSIRAACAGAGARTRARVLCRPAAAIRNTGTPVKRSKISAVGRDAGGLPEIKRGRKNRDRGAARFRHHLRGVGLQRVVQHVEAEPDGRDRERRNIGMRLERQHRCTRARAQCRRPRPI